MKIAGIVCEFNPLHYGHEYLIKKIKEDNVDLIISAMSPNFTMRGEPAVIDKFRRTEISIEKGIDIVLEIPTIYAVESASTYAFKSVEMLSKLDVTDLYFGVEIDDESILEKIKNIRNSSEYSELVDKYLSTGLSFNQSTKKAILDIDNSLADIVLMPNVLLGIEYLIAIEKLGVSIKPHFIKRIDSSYYGLINENKLIQSATAIRSIIDTDECKKYLSYEINTKVHKIDDYFELIKYKIMSSTPSELKNIKGVTEGLENKLKSIKNYNNISELINALVSKRNRETKIKRILIYILLNIKKGEFKDVNDIRVLGFNKKGQEYLKEFKKDNINIYSSIKRNMNEYIYREIDFTKIYSFDDEILTRKEYSPIRK